MWLTVESLSLSLSPYEPTPFFLFKILTMVHKNEIKPFGLTPRTGEDAGEALCDDPPQQMVFHHRPNSVFRELPELGGFVLKDSK